MCMCTSQSNIYIDVRRLDVYVEHDFQMHFNSKQLRKRTVARCRACLCWSAFKIVMLCFHYDLNLFYRGLSHIVLV